MALVFFQHFWTDVLDDIDCFTINSLHPSSQISKQPTENFNKVPNNNVLVQLSPGNAYEALTTG